MNSMSPSAPIRVLIVEDYDLVRQGLELLLGRQPHLSIVGAAANSVEALHLSSQEKPDVVLLDLMLGEESGFNILPELLEAGAKNVIIFTATADTDIHRNALALGAKAVIEKGQSEQQLAECIMRVHQGETVQFEEESLRIARLSKADRDLVTLVCAGVKDECIIEQLSLSPQGLQDTLKLIQRKLEVRDRVALAIYAFRHGLARTSTTE